jgi:hypothetical protein
MIQIKNSKTELCVLFEKYGADKCPSIRHDYSLIYHRLLSDYRNKSLNILEIGIGNFHLMKTIVGETYLPGASLRAWRDYFSNSTIYGIDIDPSTLFNNEERIKTYCVNQACNKSLNGFIESVILENQNDNFKFDIVIDDGSHKISDFIYSLQYLYKYFKSDGLYIIEDIYKNDLSQILKNNYLNAQFDVVYSHMGWLEDDCFIALKKKR